MRIDSATHKVAKNRDGRSPAAKPSNGFGTKYSAVGASMIAAMAPKSSQSFGRITSGVSIREPMRPEAAGRDPIFLGSCTECHRYLGAAGPIRDGEPSTDPLCARTHVGKAAPRRRAISQANAIVRECDIDLIGLALQ